MSPLPGTVPLLSRLLCAASISSATSARPLASARLDRRWPAATCGTHEHTAASTGNSQHVPGSHTTAPYGAVLDGRLGVPRGQSDGQMCGRIPVVATSPNPDRLCRWGPAEDQKLLQQQQQQSCHQQQQPPQQQPGRQKSSWYLHAPACTDTHLALGPHPLRPAVAWNTHRPVRSAAWAHQGPARGFGASSARPAVASTAQSRAQVDPPGSGGGGGAPGPPGGRAGAAGGQKDGGGSEGGSEGSGGASSSGRDGQTDGGAARPLPLRAALRLLYKQVHPDLFHDHPRAKEENERSFKLLQEYVQLARGGDARSPAARVPYRFVFYLRERPQPAPDPPAEAVAPPSYPIPPLRPPAKGSAAAAAAAASRPAARVESSGPAKADEGPNDEEVPGLHRVAVLLPPPAISHADQKDLAGATRKALAKLLAACGLATTGRDVGSGPEGDHGGGGNGGPLSLAAFLPEAVEALRQAEAARPSDPAVRVANLRGALRLHRQVMVSFSDKQLPAASQVALLERLVRLADSAPELHLQGCHIVLGDRLGLDRLGHLCLAAGEPDDAWAAFLGGVDLSFVRNQRAQVQALRSLEAQVARAAGLAQVFTPYGNLKEPAYRAFLERLASASAARGPIGGGAFREVSLCVLPADSTAPSRDAGAHGAALQPPLPPACRLDDSSCGVVQAASDMAADEVYAGVARVGPGALAVLRAQRHDEAQMRQLADKTRQRLRLRSLTRDPGVAPDHFRRVCGLLLDQAVALTPLLEGCTVKVAFANRLGPDGSCIEIAHNCEL